MFSPSALQRIHSLTDCHVNQPCRRRRCRCNSAKMHWLKRFHRRRRVGPLFPRELTQLDLHHSLLPLSLLPSPSLPSFLPIHLSDVAQHTMLFPAAAAGLSNADGLRLLGTACCRGILFSYKFLKLENVPLFAMENKEEGGGLGGGMNKTILSSRICVDVVVLHRKGTR